MPRERGGREGGGGGREGEREGGREGERGGGREGGREGGGGRVGIAWHKQTGNMHMCIMYMYM